MDILLVVMAVFGLSFFIAYVYTARQLKITTQNLAESILMYLASTDQSLDKVSDPNSDPDKIHKESFIKFLSDSRDWAFDYIERTQSTISKFIEEVEPELEYYKNYGSVIEGMIPPHDKALKKIIAEMSQLKSLLPEEIDDRR
jgi:hypothetical protein